MGVRVKGGRARSPSESGQWDFITQRGQLVFKGGKHTNPS